MHRFRFKIPLFPLEILLTDNGSTDGSVEFVKSHFPSVIILENKENLGYAEGNNRGIGIAQGKYVVTLNNDTVVEKIGSINRLNISKGTCILA